MLLPGVVVLGVLGVLLGLVVLLLPGVVVLLEPMPLELGVVVVLLPPVAPPVAPLAAPDLKYSSHSEREIWPSLFLSTAVKLGSDVPEAAPLLGMPLEAPPVAAGDELSVLPEAPVEDEPELCAIDTPAIAKSAAAVAVPTNLSMWMTSFTRIKS